jgi:hypothetical protein
VSFKNICYARKDSILTLTISYNEHLDNIPLLPSPITAHNCTGILTSPKKVFYIFHLSPQLFSISAYFSADLCDVARQVEASGDKENITILTFDKNSFVILQDIYCTWHRGKY